MSLGPQEYALTARFPNGVPAVCDVNMSEWMQYLYAEFARPADVVGVEAVLRVLDPNNYFCEVGRTTSDASHVHTCNCFYKELLEKLFYPMNRLHFLYWRRVYLFGARLR